MIRIRGILVKRREDFKRFVVFCLASLVVIAQTAVFAYIWYDFYRGLIFEPFWRKGNWVLIAIYALINVLFSRLYGGLKVGYLKRIDVFYSMTIATIAARPRDASPDDQQEDRRLQHVQIFPPPQILQIHR